MTEELEPHQSRIRRIGRILFILSWIWVGVYALATLMVLLSTIIFGVFDDREFLVGLLAGPEAYEGFPGDAALLDKILLWDLDWYQGAWGIAAGAVVLHIGIFIATMIYVLRIAGCWKRGDVFGDRPIRALRMVGWITLGHAIAAIAANMAGFMLPWSNSTVLYFSFCYDVATFTFSSGVSGGFIFGLVALAMSWVLESGRKMRDEQALTI